MHHRADAGKIENPLSGAGGEVGVRVVGIQRRSCVTVKFFETPRSVFLLPCSARKLLAVDCLERSAVAVGHHQHVTTHPCSTSIASLIYP